MTTLVVCLDRTGDIGRKTDIDMPVAGWSRVRSLVTDIGLSDPEDSNVNAILEGLRITRSIREEGNAATVPGELTRPSRPTVLSPGNSIR